MAVSAGKRIAQNTFMLYFRMLIIMLVSLYTSRIILNILGVEDYGIYNVVGGVVVMLGFLNTSISTSTQRFISFELGRKNAEQLTRVFSMSININVLIALVVFILAETAGIWFLNRHLTIPDNRLLAANWVFQFSLLTFIASIIGTPYNALIIAHEQMKIYAYVSIVEVSLKLLIVFMLQWFGFDKLKLYAILVFIVALLNPLAYALYCRRKFNETRYRFFWDKSLFRTLVSYAGWNLWGSLSVVMYDQGLNILLNIFFGPVVNAARGVAYQVRSATLTFMYNFQMAMKPQIVKSFAAKDLRFMHQLVFKSSKYSFFLLFLLCVPVLLDTSYILKTWLKVVPGYTIIFTRLALLNVLIDGLLKPLMSAAQASGKVKLYQSITGSLYILILPVSWLFLKLGYPPQATVYVSIVVSAFCFYPMLRIDKFLVGLSAAEFFNQVIIRVLPVASVSILFPLIIRYSMDEGFLRLIILVVAAWASIIASIYLLGTDQTERQYIHSYLKKVFRMVHQKVYPWIQFIEKLSVSTNNK